MLAALGQCTGEGAVSSLLVRNGLAPAMRAGLRGDWTEQVRLGDVEQGDEAVGLEPVAGHRRPVAFGELDGVLGGCASRG
jgi:hypothetical protein